MRYAGLVFLLSLNFLHADTYIYRVDINKVNLTDIKTEIYSTEIKDASQPYINTQFMAQPDTNYFLVSLTPKDGKDFKLELKLPGVDKYQILKLDEDGFFTKPLNNSSLYPTNRDWKVKTSS